LFEVFIYAVLGHAGFRLSKQRAFSGGIVPEKGFGPAVDDCVWDEDMWVVAGGVLFP